MEAQRYEGFLWRLVVTPDKLESLRKGYNMPKAMNFKVSPSDEG